MSCIGTAGHVDHGKSTLVTALTGIDPDRLAEEKARGMTIDLGFAWLHLPSGREVSVVDVPGHESFIKNMLAGVGGIDVALLVIAADEGVMPQTSEHLAILDLLQVRSGVVALTKSDLVDSDWLELVTEEVREALAHTTLADAPILPVSAITGAGLPELRAALDAALDRAEARRDLGRPRLPVDRVFTVTGFGTVVTGTLQAGSLRAGQEIEVLPSGLRARIRGLQAHKHAVEEGAPGGRLAVNLAGLAKQDLRRGDVVTLPGRYRATTALDVRLDVLASAPRAIAHNAHLDLYLGAAEVEARVLLLEGESIEPGESGWAQLRLAHPIVAAHGDRFILRVPSPSLTVGGGVIVEPWARRHRRRDASVVARLELLARGDPEEVVLAALGPQKATAAKGAGNGSKTKATGIGRSAAEVAATTGLPDDLVAGALSGLRERSQAREIGTRWYGAERWEAIEHDGVRILAQYHAEYSLRSGMPREEWRARLGLGAAEAADVVAALAREGVLAETSAGGRGAFLRLPDHEAKPTPEQERALAAILTRFRADPFAPPTRAEVEDAIGPELTAALLERGTLVKLSDTILLESAAYDEMLRRIVGHLRAHGTLTVAEARDLLGTSRKYMVAIFEHLDAKHITSRKGDDRVLGPRAPELAPASASERAENEG